MQQKVLKPIGMRRSTFVQPLPEKLRSHAASGYNREGVKVAGEWHIYPEMAAAGLWTTPSDLARFAMAVQRSYAADGGLLSQRMTHLMLTPGMNNDGLGFFITEDGKRFGHGGADEGFQANLTCYLDSASGIAVMTNSDNGNRLAEELMLSIARQYGWSGFPQTERTPVRLPREAYQRLAGHYKLDGAGEFDLTLKGEHLVVSGPEYPEREILAESDNHFFVRDDGTPIEVSSENGSTVLKIGGAARAVRSSPPPN
jgi:CubicO group peptidase (beta-lactamase class C family)